MNPSSLHDMGLFEEYIERFRRILRLRMRKEGLSYREDLDLDIRECAGRDVRILKNALLEPVRDMFRNELPYSRVGDKVFSYIIFVERHLRTPSDRLVFNDVLHAMKVTDRILDPLRVFVSDKDLVKIYVKATVGDKYNVPTICVLHASDEVAAFDFPDSCCIKPTHLSGHIVFRNDGAEIPTGKMQEWFSLSQYRHGRQANYRYLAPKIIVEPIVFGRSYALDCKVMCYRGVPRIVYLVSGRPDKIRFAMFDTAWNRLPYSIDAWPYKGDIGRPRNLDEILDVAARLSRPFDFIRIDFYSDGRRIFVGEITNCPQNALGLFPQEGGEERVSEILFQS